MGMNSSYKPRDFFVLTKSGKRIDWGKTEDKINKFVDKNGTGNPTIDELLVTNIYSELKDLVKKYGNKTICEILKAERDEKDG